MDSTRIVNFLLGSDSPFLLTLIACVLLSGYVWLYAVPALKASKKISDLDDTLVAVAEALGKANSSADSGAEFVALVNEVKSIASDLETLSVYMKRIEESIRDNTHSNANDHKDQYRAIQDLQRSVMDMSSRMLVIQGLLYNRASHRGSIAEDFNINGIR